MSNVDTISKTKLKIINKEVIKDMDTILTPEAMEFIYKLQLQFGDRREELLEQRKENQKNIINQSKKKLTVIIIQNT